MMRSNTYSRAQCDSRDRNNVIIRELEDGEASLIDEIPGRAVSI